MANFGCFPQEVIEKILQFLPLRDQINSGFVCARWNEVVEYNLKHVTIDPSMPFGGRWGEENLRWIDHGRRYEEKDPYYYTEKDWQHKKVWFRDENDPADKEMKKLLPKLCKLSNKIETLNIENYHLDTESLTELLSSCQTGLKTLRIKIRNLPLWVRNVYFVNIVEVIIRHQETIEVIEIKIDTRGRGSRMSEKSITEMQGIITSKGRLSFPRLKSLKLTQESFGAINRLLSNDLFGSLIASSQLEELNIGRVFILPYIKNGNLDLLKKCSVLYFEDDEDDEDEAEELIKHCPHIHHLYAWRDWSENPWEYARSVLKIISTYGPQLTFFGCNVISRETANAILEECKSVESLLLEFHSLDQAKIDIYDWIDETLSIERSIPLFGYLEKLTEIELRFLDFEVKAEVICELVKRCGMNLQSLKMEFKYPAHETHKIFNAIGANCKNLKKLKLYVYDSRENTEVKESVETILEGCQKLRTLDLGVGCHNPKLAHMIKSNHIIYDQIGNKLPHLRKVKLDYLMDYPKPNFVKLIQALPYCNIEILRYRGVRST